MMHSYRRILSYTGIVTLFSLALCVAMPTAWAQDGGSLDLETFELIEENTIPPLLPEGSLPKEELLIEDVTAEAATPPESEELDAPVALSEEEREIPKAPVSEEFSENLFFDAEALIPNAELSRRGVPSNVNPVLSPGSRLVVTHKNKNAGSKDARLVAADRALTLGRFESALEIYNGLYQSNNRDPNILMGRAISLQRLGRNEEAVRAYEEFLNLRPKNIEAQVNLHGLLSARYPAVALRNLLELYDDNPGNTAVVAQLAVVEARLGHYPEALRFLGVAASTEPENASHVFNMAIIADRAGDKKQAVQFYEEALEVDTLYGAGKTIPRETIFQRLAELR